MSAQKNIILLSLFCFFFLEVTAQVGIGTTSPDASSVLDIESADSGVLMPRIALTSTALFAPISVTPEESLLVYNTNTTTGTNAVSPGYYYWKNDKWNRINDNTDKVYGEIYNNTSSRTQDMDVLEPIRFHILGEIRGVIPTPLTAPYEGFEIITSGIYRVSYGISFEMYKLSDPRPSAVRGGFYLTKGVVDPANIMDLYNNRIPGSYSYSRVEDTGYSSCSMTKIVRLNAGDHIRLFNYQTLAIVYVLPDTATMNIELIEAD